MVQKLQSLDKDRKDQIDLDEIAEIQAAESMRQRRSFFNRVPEILESFASTRLGQFVVERLDRVLNTVEDTAKWSLPLEKRVEPLDRPMSWIPFILLIVMLRATRFWISVGALLIGNGPVTPHDMVYFIQTRRRKLRALKVNGIRNIRQRERELSFIEDGEKRKGILANVKLLLSRAICQPGQPRDVGKLVFIQRSKFYDSKSTNEQQAIKRPRDEDESEDQNLTADQMLSKYANRNSDDDSDYEPTARSADDSSTSIESVNSTLEEKIEKATTAIPEADRTNKNIHQRIEIKENGGRKRLLPKPIQEIKKEPTSEDSSNEHQPVDDVAQNGDDDVAKVEHVELEKFKTSAQARQKHNIAIKDNDELKATPGHENAAGTAPPTFNVSAAGATTTESSHLSQNPTILFSPNSGTELSTVETLTFLPAKEVSDVETPSIIDKLDYSTPLPLTPATSSEDVFYSPIGSPTRLFKPIPKSSSVVSADAQGKNSSQNDSFHA